MAARGSSVPPGLLFYPVATKKHHAESLRASRGHGSCGLS
jgi:hypothetical protein